MKKKSLLTNKQVEKRHGQFVPPPPPNTIKEYFTPILLGLIEQRQIYTKVERLPVVYYLRIWRLNTYFSGL